MANIASDEVSDVDLDAADLDVADLYAADLYAADYGDGERRLKYCLALGAAIFSFAAFILLLFLPGLAAELRLLTTGILAASGGTALTLGYFWQGSIRSGTAIEAFEPGSPVARTAQQLALPPSRFDQIFQSSPIAMMVLNDDLLISDANPNMQNLFGAERTVKGRAAMDLFVLEDAEVLARHCRQALAGQPWSGSLELRLDRSDGDAQVQIFGSQFASRNQPNSLLLQLVDTTEQRSLELQFAQSQKLQAVGQLAGGVSHDFNNLLTAIIGHCDLLLQRTRPRDELFPDIIQIKQNANRAANLTRQLLAFSRQQMLRPKLLSLTDVLAELSHLIRRLLGENLSLEVEHGRDLGLVLVDQGQFEQIVINLAVNARDAMPDGGTLSIRTANIFRADLDNSENALMPVGDYVLIEVEDTGKGMRPEDMRRIFEPFFTTKPAKPGVGGSGTGLGLSTVFGIVKQSGGYIFPESTLGEGTVFRVYLPMQEKQPANSAVAADPKPQSEAAEEDLTGKGTILLVEDETGVRMFAARALRNQGYKVLEAENGEAALQILAQADWDIDLMISDVIMPNIDGPTLLAEVRKQLPDLKVIFVSGYAEEAFRNILDQDASFELLPKPFSLQQLSRKVKEMLDV